MVKRIVMEMESGQIGKERQPDVYTQQNKQYDRVVPRQWVAVKAPCLNVLCVLHVILNINMIVPL